MIEKYKKIYFLGIGGIGMSALAMYFRKKGCHVSGYDRTPTALTSKLIDEGIPVHFEENISAIPSDIDLVIYTPAIPKDHKEFVYLQKLNIPIKKRAEILGLITDNKFTVAVAGTHGKTTICGMIAHILNTAGKPINAFVGGIMNNYSSNLILSENPEYFICEADEYDRSFLWLKPDIAVISAIDADHLDVYKNKNNLNDNFIAFAGNVKKHGKIVIKKSLKLLTNEHCKKYSFSKDEKADFYAANIKVQDGNYVFDAYCNGIEITNIKISVPGRHNVENALAAMAVCSLMDINLQQIKKGIETFQGIWRRFDIRYKDSSRVYIDDYAHHPEELKAFISAVRELYPGKKICGVFQPHLYSRTLHFAAEFAEALDMLDVCYLLEIYPARELPIEGVSSEIILKKMKLKEKKILTVIELYEEIKSRKFEVLLTMGAGDIDKTVSEIEKIMKEHN